MSVCVGSYCEARRTVVSLFDKSFAPHMEQLEQVSKDNAAFNENSDKAKASKSTSSTVDASDSDAQRAYEESMTEMLLDEADINKG